MPIDTASTITQIPWGNIFTATISSFSGIVGALGGAFLANRFAEKRWEKQNAYDDEAQKKKILREKGEELHVLVTEWAKATANYQLSQLSVSKGKYGEKMHIEVMQKLFKDGRHDRLETLLFLYFSSLTSHMDEARKYLNMSNLAYDNFLIDNLDSDAASKIIDKAIGKTGDALDELRAGIRKTIAI
ncbi:hypothetical protein [Pantoea agglomerans]|uniref:hypothetical protein n=1 Tax=Enterobacter agglomerans TaxID=549 RepID=UPI001F3CE3FD|nr:hypothetical protein [Pantoea agglomerans]UJL38423.1 hypothetical protein JK642_06650 [Pantoea agglomerans]